MNKKCPSCDLLNFRDAKFCQRCYTLISTVSLNSDRENGGIARMLIRRALICIGMCLFVLVGFYASLVFSSKSLNAEESAKVEKAIELLEKKGFYEEVYYLRNFAVFRGSDNWLNSLVQKENAYAATNYPFEIMTIYPDFFTYTKDDVERAAILLHEAKHLQGEEEKVAYEFVWKNRQALGWTEAEYHKSVLWKNVRRQTREYAPNLFICEFNNYGDCTNDGSLIDGIVEKASLSNSF